MENLSNASTKPTEKSSKDDEQCYSIEELKGVFAYVGDDVHVDRTVRIFNGRKIMIGNHVRIDSYGILSAGSNGINIGNYVHIGPFSQLNGSGGSIHIDDFCSLSSRVSIFTATDDYWGGHMTGPMIPNQYRKVRGGNVVLKRHCIVGCNAMIINYGDHNLKLNYGSSVGAFSLVNKSVPDGFVVSGQPARRISNRNLERLIELEEKFNAEFR